MAKNWAFTELKQKIEDDISDEKARKSILKLFVTKIQLKSKSRSTSSITYIPI